MNFFYRKKHPFTLPLALCLALLAGCATIPKEVFDTEPSSQLEQSPQVYVRLSGESLRDIAATINEKEMASFAKAISAQNVKLNGNADLDDANSPGKDSVMNTSMLKSFLAKTRTFGAGIRGIGTISPAMEAIFIGDFPVMSVRLGLAVDGNWEKTEEGGYRSVKYPIFIRPPQPGIIHAATTPSPVLLASREITAFPKKLSDLANSDIFIAANTPAVFFSGPLPMEASSIPVNAIVMTGRRSRPEWTTPPSSQGVAIADPLSSEPRYILDVRILMKNEATARAYKPVVKFLWTAAAAKLFGEEVDVSTLQLTLENDVYVMRGIEVDAAGLKAMFTSSIFNY